MDQDRTPDSHVPLRPVEFHILLSLSAGDRHGYGILQDAKALGESLDVGTLYRALTRMLDDGLVATASKRKVEDERRIYYRITAKGMRVARAEAQRITALARAARVGGLLEANG